MSKTLYFVAINYNNYELTYNYCKSLEDQTTNHDMRIIIIDNNSKLEDYTQLQESLKVFSNVTIIRSKTNLGYFRGINLALDNIKDKKDKLIIVGNNDLEFGNDFVRKLSEISFKPEVYVIAPNVVTKDGIKQNPHYINKINKIQKMWFKLYFTNYYVAQFLSKISYFKKKYLGDKNKKAYKEMFIYQGVGAIYILTHNFFNKFEKLRSEVFLWGEELLLASQIEEVGGKMLYKPELLVNHMENMSVKKIKTKEAYEIGRHSYSIYKKYM